MDINNTSVVYFVVSYNKMNTVEQIVFILKLMMTSLK